MFYDPDSTYRYELLAGIQLQNNTICGASRMAAFYRLGPDEPSITQRYLHQF